MSLLLAAVVSGIIKGESTNFIAFPATYDETDHTATYSWARLGPGPHITPQGMLGDGYQSRYKVNSGLPTWLTAAGDALTLHATVQPYGKGDATRDVAAYVGSDTLDRPKLEIVTLKAPAAEQQATTAVRTYTSSMQTQEAVRQGWKYEMPMPVKQIGADIGYPQAVKDAGSDIYVTSHFADNYSRCYRLNKSTGAMTGWFQFAAGYNHIATAADDAGGGIWFIDYTTSKIQKIDMAASFSSNAAVVLAEVTLSGFTQPGLLEFVTISGTDYVVIGEYRTSGTPYLYLYNASVMVDAATLTPAGRVKRLTAPLTTQGIVYRSGLLYAGRSVATGGLIETIAFDSWVTGGGDGALFTAYPGNFTYYPPTEQVEDLDFDSGGRLWTATEGYDSAGDDLAFIAVWSSGLVLDDEPNHYTVRYDGAGTVTIKINNRDFAVKSWTPTTAPSAISIGGLPNASAGRGAGFYVGHVRNVVVQPSALTGSQYTAAVSGAHESNTLTAYTVTITNPGAESGTTGWTNEVGSLTTRAANPAPYEGAAYFNGGSNAQTIARQRFSLATVTGLSTGALDAATMWAVARWRQAGFTTTDNDVGSLGLRFLDGTPTSLSETYNGLIDVLPDLAWAHRSHSDDKPASARNIDILYRADRNAGTNNDVYIDAITLTLYMQ